MFKNQSGFFSLSLQPLQGSATRLLVPLGSAELPAAC